MGYTPLQRTRKGNKIGSSRGTALHSAGPLGKGQMRHGVVTTTPAPDVVRGSGFCSGGDNSYELFFSKFALNSNDTAVYSWSRVLRTRGVKNFRLAFWRFP